MNVVRLNQRNCGDTEHLSAGLFHSGLTADAARVIRELIAVERCRPENIDDVKCVLHEINLRASFRDSRC